MKDDISTEKVSRILKVSDLIGSKNCLHPAGRKLVLVGGCFDIFHRGHVEFLQKASEYGDVLVMLESDENVKRRKGNGRPVHVQMDRARIVSSARGVWRVLLLPDMTSDYKYFELVKRIQPDIIGITEGDPFTSTMHKYAKEVGAEVVEVLSRIPGYSTREIIKKAKEL